MSHLLVSPLAPGALLSPELLLQFLTHHLAQRRHLRRFLAELPLPPHFLAQMHLPLCLFAELTPPPHL